ncbi:MAG: glucose-1-phosphate adenylyltransferase [Actinomycetota bacterium]|nr:glucose-1-phosphate adenylyltransferase [Actinomycetota bacterium]
MDLTRPKVLALVLAGGEGGRLDVLTAERAKPALPFAGVYRLIDFALSNCRHSGIGDVWVVQQYEPHSLTEHLANGRPWDLDRTHGGLRVLHPHLGREESGWYRGNADAIYRSKEDIRDFRPELVLVLSADHVYRLDYSRVVAAHRDHGADATLVTAPVTDAEASRFGVVQIAEDGRILDYAYKPEEPVGNVVATEVFLFEADALLDSLDQLADDAPDDSGLADLGDEVLPRLVREGRAREYRLDGYWRDVGTVESYWEAHMELLAADPPIELDDPGWPILTWSTHPPPARIETSARIEDALVSPGSSIRGRVVRSVIGPGAVVEEGAEVRDSVLLERAVVGSGARVVRAIVDAEAAIEADARVGAEGEEIALVGMRAAVARGRVVAPDARVEPVSA